MSLGVAKDDEELEAQPQARQSQARAGDGVIKIRQQAEQALAHADRRAAERLEQAESVLQDAREASDVFLQELRRVGPYALEGIDEALLRVREDSRQALWTRIEELRREAAAKSPAGRGWRPEFPTLGEPHDADMRQAERKLSRRAEPAVYPPPPIAAGVAAELVAAAPAAEPHPVEIESPPVPQEDLEPVEEDDASGVLEDGEAIDEGQPEPSNHRTRTWTRGGLGVGALGLVALLFAAWAQWGSGYRAGLGQQELRNAFEISRALHSPGGDEVSTAGPQAESRDGEEDPPPDLGAPVAVIEIPGIDLETVAVEGSTYAQLRQGPGHVIDSASPGHAGNAIFLGRRTSYGGPFSRLGELAPGDDVFLTTLRGRIQYRVTEPPTVIASEEEAPVGDGDGDRLTLVTSNPRFGLSELLVVSANAEEALPVGPSRDATDADAIDQQRRPRGSPVPVVAWAGALALLSLALHRLVATRGRLVLFGGLPVAAVVLLRLFESVDGLLPPTF